MFLLVGRNEAQSMQESQSSLCHLISGRKMDFQSVQLSKLSKKETGLVYEGMGSFKGINGFFKYLETLEEIQ